MYETVYASAACVCQSENRHLQRTTYGTINIQIAIHGNEKKKQSLEKHMNEPLESLKNDI